jgi:hypothetical protein
VVKSKTKAKTTNATQRGRPATGDVAGMRKRRQAGRQTMSIQHGDEIGGAAAGDTGWIDLLRTFAAASLPAPPVPAAFHAQLMRRSAWCWSTVPIDPMKMYFLEPAVRGREGAREYAAVSHAGHGVNSYGLNFYLVTGSLGIFIQHGWGGIYSDPQHSTAQIARTYVLLNELLSSLKPMDDRTRHVLIYSDFRRVGTYLQVAAGSVLPSREIGANLFDANETKSSGSSSDQGDAVARLFAHVGRILCDPNVGTSLSRLVREGRD